MLWGNKFHVIEHEYRKQKFLFMKTQTLLRALGVVLVSFLLFSFVLKRHNEISLDHLTKKQKPLTTYELLIQYPPGVLPIEKQAIRDCIDNRFYISITGFSKCTSENNTEILYIEIEPPKDGVAVVDEDEERPEDSKYYNILNYSPSSLNNALRECGAAFGSLNLNCEDFALINFNFDNKF